MKNKILYIIGLLCGLIPLTVGLFIFFAWWTARAFFAFDLSSFEAYGFLWIIDIPFKIIRGFIIKVGKAVKKDEPKKEEVKDGKHYY